MHLRNAWKVLAFVFPFAVTACSGYQESANAPVSEVRFNSLVAVGKEDVKAFREVIALQIDAFHSNDAEAAYKLATPEIQSLFPTPQAFMRAARKLYQPIYGAEKYSFEKASVIEGQIIQPVRIAMSPDLPLLAMFILEQQSDGAWKIAGCILLRDDGQNI